MPGKRLGTRLLLGGVAAAGVVGSHSLAYLVAAPDPHIRARQLEATGHDHFGAIVAAALAILVAGLVRFVSGRAWAATDVWTPQLYARTVARLLALQLGGFAGLEMVERALMGQSPLGIAAEPAVVIGLLLQAIAALIGAGLIILFAKTLQRAFRRQPLTAPVDDRLSLKPTRRLLPSRVEVAVGSGTLRGPPAGF